MTGAVTTVVDRLERKGFARRMRDTGDRRRVLVELTDDARRGAAAFYEPLARGATELIEPLSNAQLKLMVDFLRAGRELNERALRDLLASAD